MFPEFRSLRQQLADTQLNAFASSTRKNIISQCKAYLTFTIYFGLPDFPATPIRLALFAQFLSRSFESVSSIQNYLSGVRTFHLILGLPPPNLNDSVVKLCTQGLQRGKPGLVHRAHPITPDMLSLMARHVDPNNLQQWAGWTAILIGFFTFSRRSNLVPISPTKFNPEHQLQRADILVNHGQLVVIFKWSKTNQFSRRALPVPVSALPGTLICPVAAYNHLIATLPARSSDPAFAFLKHGKITPFSQSQLQELIKQLASDIDLDPSNFSTHSLRRGGATFASKTGCGPEQIKNFGDWKSDCFRIYTDISFQDRTTVADSMAKKILAECAEVNSGRHSYC